MRQSSGPRVALPLPANEAPHIKENTPGNSTSRSTLFGSFTPTRSEENPAHTQQPPRKPHLPYLSQDSEVTVAPCCLTCSSHGLGSSWLHIHRRAEKRCPNLHIGSDSRQTATVNTDPLHGHKPNTHPGPKHSQGDPVPATTRQHSGGGVQQWMESSHLWQAQKGSRSGRNTARERRGWSQTCRPKV